MSPDLTAARAPRRQGAVILSGVDPGISGGLAFLPLEPGELPEAQAMPETEAELTQALEAWEAAGPRLAFLEWVHPHPKHGVIAAFKLGQSYGQLRQALHVAGIPYRKVSPSTWKRALGLRSGATKVDSRRLAGELFPHLRAGRVTNATVEALLIAEFGRRSLPDLERQAEDLLAAAAERGGDAAP